MARIVCLAFCFVTLALSGIRASPTKQDLFKHEGIDTSPSKYDLFKHNDCYSRWQMGERKSGVYPIYPNTTHPVKVYCNHTEAGSYTVIQRRMNGDVSFYQNWQAYKQGFGTANTDYWAGLDYISHLTNTGNNILHIQMSDWHGNTRYATYQHFLVMNEAQYYRMIVSGFSGNVQDDMAHQNGMYFYTPDRYDQHKCAISQRCGWWFNYCAYTLPNGFYYQGGPYTPGPGQFYDGIYWRDWLGFGYSMKFFSMSLYRS